MFEEYAIDDLDRAVLPADPYYSPEYGAAAANQDGGTWKCWSWRNGDVVIPSILRPVPSAEGFFDLISPYGYSGPCYAEGLSDSDVMAFDRDWVAMLAERNIISEFVRYSPWTSDAERTGRLVSDLEVAESGTVYSVLCEGADADEVLSRFESRTRTKARKGLRNDLEIAVFSGDELDDDHFAAFKALYTATMVRVGASERYLFSAEYWQNLQSMPGLWQVDVLHKGTVVYSGLLMAGSSRTHLHLTGSTAEAGKLAAGPFCYWQAAVHAGQLGMKEMHIGGGMEPGDSLDYFKQSFGGTARTFHVGRRVVLDEKYEELARSIPKSNFFPLYRSAQ